MARRRTSAPRPTPQGNDFSWAVLPSISLARSVRPVLTPPRAGARGGNLSWAQAPNGGVHLASYQGGNFGGGTSVCQQLMLSIAAGHNCCPISIVVRLSRSWGYSCQRKCTVFFAEFCSVQLQRLSKLPHISSDSKKQACTKGQG